MPINDVQTTNRQHAVPQNIMDVEFKIIGDLTMRQFIYLMIFGAFAYGSFISISSVLKWFAIVFFVLAGIAFAFLPIEERGVDQWVINFIKAIYMPNQRIWKKDPEVPQAFSFENIEVMKSELITLTPTSSRRKLEEFLNMQNLQAAVDPLDIPEFDYRQKVREAFAGVVVEAPVEVVPETELSTPMPIPTPKESIQPQPNKHSKEATHKHEEQPKPEKHVEKHTETIREKPAKQTPVITKPKKATKSLSPMTPDQHTGRRFTNLLPNQGEIVLPIRGERVLKTTEELKIDEDIDEKTKQLKQLLDQITKEENVVLPSQQTQSNQIPQQPQPVTPPSPQTTQAPQQPAATPIMPKANMETNAGTPATFANMNPMTNKPNILTGVVKDQTGKPLQGLVLIIKNEKDEPVRALKTNQLGQFSISTPLSNGKYIIETDKSKKTGLSFDIINIDIHGNVVPPVEITGK